VPTTVCKTVPVCKEYEVCVKKPRWVCVQEACPAPCPTPCPTSAYNPCSTGDCCPAAKAGPFHNPNVAFPGLFNGCCDKLFKCRLGCSTSDCK
jgi:hypothetical protein